MGTASSGPASALFANPFHIEDVQVFDDEALHDLLTHEGHGICTELLATALHAAPQTLIQRILRTQPIAQREHFQRSLARSITHEEVLQAQQQVLDGLFWELIYWKMPEAYVELTQGERLHPGIFQQIGPALRGKTVLDAGAGSGRASFECLRSEAERVYAVEPSPGLVRMLKASSSQCLVPRIGRFDALPLEDSSVDVALSCSAFTAEPDQGGENGLAELLRVIRPGGTIYIIWPRLVDHDWFAEHGFRYVSLPLHDEMTVSFRSLESALRCARLFYAHKLEVEDYLLTTRRPEVPFSVIGLNPPHDYYWLRAASR